MIKYSVHYYSEKVYRDIISWPENILARYLRMIDSVEHYGYHPEMPDAKSLGKGLFEFRVKGFEGIGRAFFCYMKDQRVMILHGFIKKSQKTPRKEIEIAIQRLKRILNHDKKQN